MTTVHCSHCNEENPINARFCIECGSTLEVQAAVGATVRLPTTRCNHCGSNSPIDARFCVICGHSNQVATAQAQQTSIPASQYTDQASANQSYGSRQHYPVQPQPYQQPHVSPRPIAPMPQARSQMAFPIIPIVFGFGIFFLISRGMIFPGIFILFALVSVLQSMIYGNNSQHTMRLILIGVALFLMFGLKFWFLGIILLMAMNSILNSMFCNTQSNP